MGWVVNATPPLIYPRERPSTYCIGGCVGPRAGLDGWGKSRPHLHYIILKATRCRTQNIGWGLSFARYGGEEIPLIDTGF